MNKIPLEIIALTSSVTQLQSYAVVLGEIGGLRRIPIVIGSAEAQSIAVAMEHIQPTRPLTHDLMHEMMLSFQIELKEAIIYKLSEGIFYAHLLCVQHGTEVMIDSRTSDAIALSIRSNTPIFTYEHILNEAASFGEETAQDIDNITENLKPDPTPEPAPKKPYTPTSSLKHYANEELRTMMQKALENEDYDLAIQLRDELKARGEA